MQYSRDALSLPLLSNAGYLDPSAANGYAQNILERLEKPLINAPEKHVILCGDMVGVANIPDAPYVVFDTEFTKEILEDAAQILFLGSLEGTNIFALAYAPREKEEAEKLHKNLKFVPIRTLIGKASLPDNHYGMLAQARSVLGWHHSHQYCSKCGAKSVSAAHGRRRDCPSCGAQHFPRTDPVVIMLGIHEDKCLMARHHRLEQIYTTLAGFVEPGETIEDAVRRELNEEAGVITGEVRYACSQPWPFVSSLMIGAYAEVTNPNIKIEEEELIEAKWFTREEAAALPLNLGQETDEFMIPPPFTIAHRLIMGFVAQK